VAFVLLFVLSLSLWTVLILAVVVGTYEMAVVRLASLAPDEEPDVAASDESDSADRGTGATGDEVDSAGAPPQQRTPAEPAEPAVR
jgi:hypothetical protein